MIRVEFIASEDGPDLIVSFAMFPSAVRSLTLLRSPQYEHLLPEDERGVTVSPLDPHEPTTDFLRAVQWLESRVVLKSARHEYTLDITDVSQDEVAQAKAVLKKMAKDGTVHLDGV